MAPDVEIDHEIATICEDINTHAVFAFICHPDSYQLGIRYTVNEMPLPSAVPDGNYIVYPALRIKNGNWNKFTFYDNRQKEISLSVINGEFTYKNEGIVDLLDEGTLELDGVYYILNEDNTATVTYRNNKYGSYSGNVTIPSSITVDGKNYKVEKIGAEAFCQCNLNELVIGSNIKTIDAGFFLCSIQSLKFAQPSSLETILARGFNGCTVDIIELPLGLKTIYALAFQTLNATKIDIPSSVEFISGNTFNYAHVKDVYVHWKSENELPETHPHSHIFANCNWKEINLHVPKGTASIYANAPQWKDLNIVESEASGINDISTDSSNELKAYRLDGVSIPDSEHKSLAPGFYIINGKKILVK